MIIWQPAFENSRNADVFTRNDSGRLCPAVALKGANPTGVSFKADFNRTKGAVVDWYSQQTKSYEPPPADPRDALGLTSTGYTSWRIVTLPASDL
jgi:hypothetical protein